MITKRQAMDFLQEGRRLGLVDEDGQVIIEDVETESELTVLEDYAERAKNMASEITMICEKCGDSLEGKIVAYCTISGQILICKDCWEKMTVKEKLPYIF